MTIIKSLDTPVAKSSLPFTIAIISIAIIIGLFSGYGISLATKSKSSTTTTSSTTKLSNAKVLESVGVNDPKTFPDSAEGIIQEGGSEGEGSFNLVRTGGASQTVYLTSSAVDMNPFINKKVRIRGKTQYSPKVSWLMDVGYVEVLAK
ncbi:MAG: hypothetical protein WCO06_02620 [Candidatus Roizmanbacteria bacterium]